jgi:hypothetical protein
LSYYDATLATAAQFYAGPATTYSRIYHYDPLGWVDSFGFTSGDTTTAWMSNVFMASIFARRIRAVSVYTPVADSTYEVYVYSNVTPVSGPRSGTLVTSKTGTLEIPGYNTIALPPGLVAANKPFSIVMKLTTPDYSFPIPAETKKSGYSSAASACPGQTFISHDGVIWSDAGGEFNVNLKVFATR